MENKENTYKIYNPCTFIETTLTVDDEHDEFHVISEKMINNENYSDLVVGNRWEPLDEEKPKLKVVKKKEKKVKRPAKTFGKNKNK